MLLGGDLDLRLIFSFYLGILGVIWGVNIRNCRMSKVDWIEMLMVENEGIYKLGKRKLEFDEGCCLGFS